MKSTKLQTQQRVEEVLQIRLMGAEVWNIRQHAAEQGWNVSERQLYRYIARADELMARHLEKDRDKLFNRHHAQRRALLARALEVSDFRAALAIMKDEADLLGLYPAKKHELAGQDGGPLGVDLRHEYEHLRTLPPDELIRLHRATLGLPGPGGGNGAGP
jgi:hypothetical protein